MPWEPAFATGHPLLDEQHAALLALCNELGTHCRAGQGTEADRAFDETFARLKSLAKQHFDAEAALLEGLGEEALEAHHDECDEFEYLAAEIATPDHFDRAELQHFVALWVYGHVRGAAAHFGSAPGTAPAHHGRD